MKLEIIEPALGKWMNEVTQLLCFQPDVPTQHKTDLCNALNDYNMVKEAQKLAQPTGEKLADQLRREAKINSVCGSLEWTDLLNRSAARIEELERAPGSLHAALLGIIGICEAYQNTDFEGMDDDRRAELGYTCSMAVIRMASAALRENTAQFTYECLCRKCGKQFQLPTKDAPHICSSCQ